MKTMILGVLVTLISVLNTACASSMYSHKITWADPVFEDNRRENRKYYSQTELGQAMAENERKIPAHWRNATTNPTATVRGVTVPYRTSYGTTVEVHSYEIDVQD